MRSLLISIRHWDEDMFRRVFNWSGRLALDRFFRWITHSADGYGYGVLVALLVVVDSAAARAVVLPALAAFSLELPGYRLLKRWVRRPRPCHALPGVHHLVVPPDRFSFPSGHTAAAVIVAILVSVHLPAVMMPLAIWAAAVGVSRVYLGVHFPSDVLAGALFGWGCAGFGLWLLG